MLLLLSSIFYFGILLLYLNCFFTLKKLSKKYVAFLFLCFYFIHYFILNLFHNLILNQLLGCSILIIFCRLLFNDNNKRIIFISCIWYVLGMCTEILTAFFLQYLDYTIEGASSIGSIISKLLMLTIVHGITLSKRHYSKHTPTIFIWIILIITTLSTILVLHTIYLLSHTQIITSHKPLTTLSTFLLLFFNIALFILYNKISSSADIEIQNLVMNHQITHYQEILANKIVQDSLFKKEQHNLKNQLITLRNYATHNQSAEIILFINRLLNEKEYGIAEASICDNVLISALISSKKNLSIANQIKYTYDTRIPSVLPYSDIDLCILLGNALDNAFDACLLDNREDCYVDVTLYHKNNCLYCNITNSCYHTLSPKSDKGFFSTKENSVQHGYGLQSIHEIVEKYQGFLDIITTDSTFCIKFILYDP